MCSQDSAPAENHNSKTENPTMSGTEKSSDLIICERGRCHVLDAPKSLLKCSGNGTRVDAQFKTNIFNESISMEILAVRTWYLFQVRARTTLAIKCDGTLAFLKLIQDILAQVPNRFATRTLRPIPAINSNDVGRQAVCVVRRTAVSALETRIRLNYTKQGRARSIEQTHAHMPNLSM